MMNRRTLWLAAIVLFFIAQLLVIGSVICTGNLVIAKGVQCRFRCRGYDPRDPLRGNYIQFTAIIETTGIDEAFVKNQTWGRRKAFVQVSEKPGEDGFTQVLRCTSAPASDGIWFGPVDIIIDNSLAHADKKDGETWEDFEKRREASPKKAMVHLKTEKFYVPEDKAKEMEKKMNTPNREAVAVYRVWKQIILLEDLEIK